MDDEEIPPSPDIDVSFRTRRKRLSKRHLSFVSSSTQENSESQISENCNETLYDRIYGEANAMDTEELFRSQTPNTSNPDEFVSDHSNDLSQTLVINETSDSGNDLSEDDIENETLKNEQLNDKLKNFLDKQISSRQQFSRQNMLKEFNCSSKDNPSTSKIVNKVDDSKETNIDLMAPFIELEMCSLSRQKSFKITPKFSQLCKSKDFMTAEDYRDKETNNGQQNQQENKSINEVTQPKVVYSMADAVLEDFDNFDDPMVVIDNSNEDELKDYRSSDDDDEDLNQSIFMSETQPHQVEFLNSSLEALSQKLKSFSQHNISLSPATSVCNLYADVSNVVNAEVPVTETEEMFDRLEEFSEPKELTRDESKSPIPVKKHLRNSRLSADSKDQPKPKKHKLEESSESPDEFILNEIQEPNSNKPKEIPTENKFCGFSMASGRKLKFNEEDLKKIASDFAKDDEKFEKEPQQPFVKKPAQSTKQLEVINSKETSKDDEKFEKEAAPTLVEKPAHSTMQPQALETTKSTSNIIEQSPLSTASIPKFSGFSMASGRKLKFNEEVLMKIASDFAKDDEKFEKEATPTLVEKPSYSTKLPQALKVPKPTSNTIEQSPLSAASIPKFSGFSMASGRTLKFNEEVLKKIESDFAKDDEKFEKEPEQPLVKKPARSTMHPQALETTKSTSNIIEQSPLSTASIPKFSGFSMASGRKLKFNEENLKKIESDFAKDDEKFEQEVQQPVVKKPLCFTKMPQVVENPKPIIENKEQCPPAIASTSKLDGFSMASGRNVKFDGEKFKKLASDFAKEYEKFGKKSQLELANPSSDFNQGLEISVPDHIEPPSIRIYPIYSGCSPMLNRENIKYLKLLYEHYDKINRIIPMRVNQANIKKIMILIKQIEFQANSRNRAVVPPNNEEEEPDNREIQLTDSSHDTMEEINTTVPTNNSVDAIETTKESSLSENEMDEYRRDMAFTVELMRRPSFFKIMDELRKVAVKKPIEVNTIEPSGSGTASTSAQVKKPIEVNTIEPSGSGTHLNNAISSSTPIKIRDNTHKRKFELDDFSSMCSPVMKAIPRIVQTADVGTPGATNLQTPTESQEVKSVLEVCKDLDDSIENIQQLPKKRRLAQTKLLSQFNESAELNSSWNDVDMELLKSVEISNNIDITIRKARKVAIDTQLEIIVHKEESLCRPVVGSMFKKKQGLQRMKINTYLEHQKPKQLNRHQVPFSTALDYHFNMQNYLSEEICLTNVVGLSVGDVATLFLNETSSITYKEIKSAFQNMPGVDPKLANEKWIKNAFKFIIFKLVWLENSFEKFMKYELLSPDNVMLHLKYRYDCEIDRCLRPAIRRIVEKDDVSSKRMVLKVCDIKENSSGCQLELTDGYYSIPTCIDAALADAVGRRKIIIGTKLIVSGAELENCESGFDPLTMPKDVKLKIHANSTRKANWDVKLGYYKNPTSLPISLDSVLPTGGVIGKLRVYVTHVYQMLYVDASSDTKVIRNEKVQNRFQNQREAKNLEIVEQIFNQVQREYETSLKHNVSLFNISGSKINADTNIEDLCDLMEIECDPESIASMQCLMTKEQIRQVDKLREERRSQQRDDIQKQIREFMGDIDKSTSQLLKFRVVDAINPKATALVSVWRPSEEVINTIKTGTFLEIINSKANPISFGNEISITVGQSSTIKVIKIVKTINDYEKFMRKETSIAEITTDFKTLNSELDVTCVIVKISEEKINNFQPVYVADGTKNLLSINFWMNMKDFGCEDAVKEGNVIYIKNLQWRESSRRNALIPSVFANEYTTFLVNPSTLELKEKLKNLKDEIGDIDEYIESCTEKINDIRGSKELPKDKENVKLMGRNNSMNLSTSSISSPVALNQRRINPIGTPDLQTPDIKRRIMRLSAFDNLPPFKPMSFNNNFKNAAFKKPF